LKSTSAESTAYLRARQLLDPPGIAIEPAAAPIAGARKLPGILRFLTRQCAGAGHVGEPDGGELAPPKGRGSSSCGRLAYKIRAVVGAAGAFVLRSLRIGE